MTMEHPKQSAPERLIIEIDGTKARLDENFLGGACSNYFAPCSPSRQWTQISLKFRESE